MSTKKIGSQEFKVFFFFFFFYISWKLSWKILLSFKKYHGKMRLGPFPWFYKSSTKIELLKETTGNGCKSTLCKRKGTKTVKCVKGTKRLDHGNVSILCQLWAQNDMRHEKTDLKIFVVVIPKEGLAGWGPANPSLGITPTIKYYSTAFIHYIL